jgi:hypothetical protein
VERRQLIRDRVERVAPVFDWLDSYGIARSWLAQRLGLSGYRVQLIEFGVVGDCDEFVERAAAVFDVTADVLRERSRRILATLEERRERERSA